MTNFDIVAAYLAHFRNFKKYKYTYLKPPYPAVPFPLPNRWTNVDYTKSTQPLHLFAMQATYTGVPAGSKQYDVIKEADDKCLANLREMQNLRFTDPVDSRTIHKIASLYKFYDLVTVMTSATTLIRK